MVVDTWAPIAATPGSEVAVKFGALHSGYFRGTVRRCRERNARVLFADGETLDVD